MDASAVYALIICATGGGRLDIPCQSQPPAFQSLTRQECVERSALIRFRHPHHRVVCMTRTQADVIDSAGELSPVREGNRMDMLGMPPR